MKEQKLGLGNAIIGFDSAEEMWAYMARQEEEAIANARPEQWQIGWGDKVLRVVETLVIWGQIFTWDEFLADNTEPGSEPDQEILDELEDLKDAHLRGYRYGRWYSTVEPRGEYGSAHVVSLWQITDSDFEQARRNDWQPWPEIIVRLRDELRLGPNQEGTEE